MNGGISHCGMNCSNCQSYKSTVADDNEMRKQTAEEWSRLYNWDIKPDDINCLGCKSDKNIIWCFQCPIRACNREHSYNNCAECGSFPCEKTEPFHERFPDAKKTLEGLKTS